MEHRARRQRGHGPRQRFPNERGAPGRGIHFELEFHVAPVVQKDSERAGSQAEQHAHLEDAQDGRASSCHEPHYRDGETHRQDQERRQLPYFLCVAEQQQLDARAERAEHEDTQQHRSQKAGAVSVGRLCLPKRHRLVDIQFHTFGRPGAIRFRFLDVNECQWSTLVLDGRGDYVDHVAVAARIWPENDCQHADRAGGVQIVMFPFHRMSPRALALTLAVLFLPAGELEAAQTEPPGTGAELYEAACAACHGSDGTGAPAAAVGFDIPLPDFSDCGFASREPDGDWLGVTHEGGPVRAFDRMMPAFGDALTEEEILRILGRVREFCDDPSWPRGELNLPRPLLTEKAFPEDESVVTVTVDADGTGAFTNEFLHEKRFGSRSQIEIVVPFTFRERASGSWRGGVGDMAFAFKRVLFHSLGSGSILSAVGEVVFPTGDADRGFGNGFTVFEPFVTYGQILPRESFVQFQGGFELPADRDRPDEAFWRTALGMTFTEANFGRTWTPIVEIVGARDLESGATTHWDIAPQMQVSLSTRQHVLFNLGVRTPLNEREGRSTQVIFYVLWDWFDGGLLDGW